MGMFNWVDFECVCPNCKSKISGFQTKDDGECELSCTTVSPKTVSNLYAPCEKCGCWAEVNRKIVECEFELVLTGKDNKELHRKKVKLKVN